MTPEEWARLTPQQQAWHLSRMNPPARPAPYPPPAGHRPPTLAPPRPPLALPSTAAHNAYATVALVCAGVALLSFAASIPAFTMVLGLVAVVLGVIGLSVARQTRRGGAVAIGAIALSALVVIVQILQLMVASASEASPPRSSESARAVESGTPERAAPPPPPPTPVAPAPQEFSGSGDDVVELDPPVDVGVVTFECSNCSRNVIVRTDDDLLVNVVGSYSGRRWIGIHGEITPRVQVNADGDWTMTVGGLDTAMRNEDSVQASGSGDEVFVWPSAPDTVRITHNGSRNFIVHALATTGGVDLVVNEVGRYEGTVLFPPDSASGLLVQIMADGDWTITAD